MTCSRWSRLIALHVGGDLDRARARKLERHLDACPSCRRFEREVRQDLDYLRELDSSAMRDNPLATVRGSVMAEVSGRRRAPAILVPARLVPVLAVAVVLVALSMLLRPGVSERESRIASRDLPTPISKVDPVPDTTPVMETRDDLLPDPAPQLAHKTQADRLLPQVPSEPPSHDQIPVLTRSVSVEPMTMKILTDDPEIVIYWIVDPKGDQEDV